MSDYNMYEFPEFLNTEASLFPVASEGCEMFASQPMFDDFSAHPTDFSQSLFNLLNSPETSALPDDSLSQAALDLFSPSLTGLLSPSLSPASTLRNSPEVSPPSTLFSSFPAETAQKPPVDAALVDMYAAMIAKIGFVPPPEIQFNLQDMLQQTGFGSQAGFQLPIAAFSQPEETQPQKEKFDAVVMPVTEELPNINAAGLRKVLETYVKRQQEALLAKQQKELDAMKPKKSKVGRKPKPRPTDPLGILQETIEKRAKNTAAARKSRQKRAEKVDELELRVAKLMKANTQNLQRSRSFSDRNSLLEKELAYAHSILQMNGLGTHVRTLSPLEVVDEVVLSDNEN